MPIRACGIAFRPPRRSRGPPILSCFRACEAASYLSEFSCVSWISFRSAEVDSESSDGITAIRLEEHSLVPVAISIGQSRTCGSKPGDLHEHVGLAEGREL